MQYFLFEARKETHEQHITKIDLDEFRSGTTNITLSHPKKGTFGGGMVHAWVGQKVTPLTSS
jgi:hypothetical protein